MAKDVITVGGEDKEVREDTAKSYRGIIWALTSVAIFIALLAVLFFGFFAKNAADGNLESPAALEKSTGR